jgi:tetratricopeptide (TPR) repeat protein
MATEIVRKKSMSMKDIRGVPVSTSNRASLDRYERAVELLHSYFNDPFAEIETALADDPDFVMGHCLKAALIVSATDRNFEPELKKTVEKLETLAPVANDRERQHMAAARAWLDGDYEGCVARYGNILEEYPLDSLALQIAHIGDFFLGQALQLRDRVARVLPFWDDGTPGYGYVLGMHAFGLEEMGDYNRAEDRGRRALGLNRRDPWAVHAVAHVMEMQGRQADGIKFMTGRIGDWAPDNGFAFHNWWHLALYHLDLGEHERVLDLYDTRIRPKPTELPLEMLDGTALLWRLRLRDVTVGDRWGELADKWEARIADRYYAFNDMHAAMSFVGDGRTAAMESLLLSLEQRANGGGTNAMMTRDVGLPVCRAIAAFGKQDYGTAIDLLLPLRAIANRFGGSHAQRDVLSLTLIEAALRAGRSRLARELAAERTELKPASPFNWLLTARSLEGMGDKVSADKARAMAQSSRSAALQQAA